MIGTFSLVSGVLRILPTGIKIAGRLVFEAVAFERYLIRAGRAGVSGTAAVEFLSDEVDERIIRGECGHIHCAVPRAELRWKIANAYGSDTVPGQRALTDGTGAAALPVREPGAAVLPEEDLWPEPPSGALRCLVCWMPLDGADCPSCQLNGWPKLPSFNEEPPPEPDVWSPDFTADPEPVTQCLSCGNPMVPGMNCVTCTAAASDVWAFQQLDPDLIEDLPWLCEHRNKKSWVLANGEHWVRCPHCGWNAAVPWPQVPELPAAWVWPDGTVTEDV